jgi:hypothetical protein
VIVRRECFDFGGPIPNFLLWVLVIDTFPVCRSQSLTSRAIASPTRQPVAASSAITPPAVRSAVAAIIFSSSAGVKG